jgi:hypothetical protein
MKKILLISLSMLFAGEMEVDGDLNVSGDIQSPTIAQLQEIIANLSNNSDVITKIYSSPFSESTNYISMSELTGVERDWYLVKPIKISEFNGGNNSGVYLFDTDYESNSGDNGAAIWKHGYVTSPYQHTEVLISNNMGISKHGGYNTYTGIVSFLVIFERALNE